MRVLVTGGAGFIGSHVVDHLVETGHNVSVVDNLSTGLREHVHADARFFEIDIRSDQLAEIFASEQPEVTCHLAAQMSVQWSLERPHDDAGINVLGTVNVLENCLASGVRKVVFASTAGVIYGDPELLPASESTIPAPLAPYGVSKIAGEEYVRLYGRLHGLDHTILRLANVYGPRQNPEGEAGVCAIFARAMLEGRPPTLYGHGNPVRDYVYVGDIARAFAAALDRGAGETLNVGTGRGTTVREIYDAIRSASGFDGEPILEPLRPGEVDQIYAAADRAAERLDWRATTALGDGIAATVDAIAKTLR